MPFKKQEQPYTFVGNWYEVPCVYGIMNAQGQMLYIGKTDNIKRRMEQHQNDTVHLMHRYAPMYVWAEVIQSEIERTVRERQLILEYNPPCNQILTR